MDGGEDRAEAGCAGDGNGADTGAVRKRGGGAGSLQVEMTTAHRGRGCGRKAWAVGVSLCTPDVPGGDLFGSPRGGGGCRVRASVVGGGSAPCGILRCFPTVNVRNINTVT